MNHDLTNIIFHRSLPNLSAISGMIHYPPRALVGYIGVETKFVTNDLGFQALWNSMIEAENLTIKYNFEVNASFFNYLPLT